MKLLVLAASLALALPTMAGNLHTFKTGEIATAKSFNDNFGGLKADAVELQARVDYLEAQADKATPAYIGPVVQYFYGNDLGFIVDPNAYDGNPMLFKDGLYFEGDSDELYLDHFQDSSCTQPVYRVNYGEIPPSYKIGLTFMGLNNRADWSDGLPYVLPQNAPIIVLIDNYYLHAEYIYDEETGHGEFAPIECVMREHYEGQQPGEYMELVPFDGPVPPTVDQMGIFLK